MQTSGEVTLLATPGLDYRFERWEGLSENLFEDEITFTMPDSNVQLTVIFEERRFGITVPNVLSFGQHKIQNKEMIIHRDESEDDPF